jgi:hypothetical protein
MTSLMEDVVDAVESPSAIWIRKTMPSRVSLDDKGAELWV